MFQAAKDLIFAKTPLEPAFPFAVRLRHGRSCIAASLAKRHRCRAVRCRGPQLDRYLGGYLGTHCVWRNRRRGSIMICTLEVATAIVVHRWSAASRWRVGIFAILMDRRAITTILLLPGVRHRLLRSMHALDRAILARRVGGVSPWLAPTGRAGADGIAALLVSLVRVDRLRQRRCITVGHVAVAMQCRVRVHALTEAVSRRGNHRALTIVGVAIASATSAARTALLAAVHAAILRVARRRVLIFVSYRCYLQLA